jgi:hypothetical protein
MIRSSNHTRRHRRGGLNRSVLGAIAGLGLLAGAHPGAAQQILEVYDSDLTSYLGSSSAVQAIWPRHHNRGVNVDGTLREGSTQGWALAGNPFGEAWDAKNRLDSIRLDTGTYDPTEIDLALPSIGVRWAIGRTYNTRQFDGGSLYTSDGYQGKDWMQTSQPELVRYEGATDAEDMLYIVYGADRYLEFKRVDGTSSYYKGKNGTAGVIKRTAGVDNVNPTPDTPEKYEYIDQNGTVTTFFGSDYAAQAAYQIWKIEDSAGNKCYVGDGSDMATAISSYDNSGSYPDLPPRFSPQSELV